MQQQKIRNFSFFSHRDCEFFPCHQVDDSERFNCIFCYCPLYALGKDCGGDFTYTESGIKDCSGCILPHSPEGYQYVTENFPKITELIKKNDIEE